MITVVGESLVDLIEDRSGEATAFPGGSPANVATALGRLGQPTTLLTQHGDDAYGRLLSDHLAGSGVRLDPASVLDLPSTSVARTTVGADGQARYDFSITWGSLPAGALRGAGASAQCLHTGSLAAFLPPGADDVLTLVHELRSDVMISFDPNCRPSLLGDRATVLRRVEELVEASDIVKVSQEDLAWLHPGRAHEKVGRDWLEMGPSLVVVTLGADGAWAVSRRGVVRVAAVPVRVVDTVGAGDAFTAGMLAALSQRGLVGAARRAALAAVDQETLAAVLTEAATVSALTCTRRGADPPTRDELTAQLARRAAPAAGSGS